MDDSWIYIDDDSVSSNDSFSYSDQIDSETEAELYSKIHYEENLPGANCLDTKNVCNETSELLVFPQDKVNTLFYEDKEGDNGQTFTEENVFQSDMDNRQKINNSSSKRQKTVLGESSSCSDDPESKNESFKHKLNKHNNNTKLNPDKRCKFNETSDIVVLDSSDSDSNLMWSEQDFRDEMQRNHIEINTTNDGNKSFGADTIYLSSSDSEDEQNALSVRHQTRNSFFKNLSMPNIKMGENSKDLWNINSEDLYRQKKSSRRYHDSSDVTCSNCNRKGHFSRACPLPKNVRCFVCGGGHVGARCANRICSNCYALGHDKKRCWKRPNDSFCPLCNMRGHVKETCPDLWRRYHLTTDLMNIQKGKKFKQSDYLFCWNCGEEGHFGAECPRLYSSKYVFGTWPCVISYSSPKHLLNRRANIIENTRKDFRGRENQRDRNGRAHIFNRRKGQHFKPKTESNVNQDNIPTEMSMTKRKEKQRRKNINRQINRAKRLMQQTDFPRTPKKERPENSVNDMPEMMKSEVRKIRSKKNKLQKKIDKLRKIREKQKQNSSVSSNK